jgi:hypothetical protein
MLAGCQSIERGQGNLATQKIPEAMARLRPGHGFPTQDMGNPIGSTPCEGARHLSVTIQFNHRWTQMNTDDKGAQAGLFAVLRPITIW